MILRIKDIPDFERPRERLLSTGASNLSNEELLAIILRCGTKQKSAKELSLDLLKELKTLPDLKKLTIHKIMSINGIGISKATMLLAVIELGRRIFSSDTISNRCNYTSSLMIYENVRNLFKDKEQEYFFKRQTTQKNNKLVVNFGENIRGILTKIKV